MLPNFYLLQGEDGEELLDENLESLHPPKMKRTHSRNGDLLGGEQVGNMSTQLFTPDTQGYRLAPLIYDVQELLKALILIKIRRGQCKLNVELLGLGAAKNKQKFRRETMLMLEPV